MDGEAARLQLAHIEGELRALHEPNSRAHALLMEALARLESLANDLHIEGLMLEYAAQVCGPHSCRLRLCVWSMPALVYEGGWKHCGAC